MHTIHGLPDPYLPQARAPRLRARVAYAGFERALARRADLLLVPSSACARLLAGRLGYDPRALRVVPNGVDVPPLREHDRTLVGTLSVLEPVKALDDFLRAAALVAAERPGARFAVHGAGGEGPALRKLADRLGIAERVVFTGHVPKEEALARLGVFVLCSRMETSGLALLEAMAAGVPAVATAVGGIPETAPPGAVALVAPGRPDQLAAAVKELLDDPSLRRARARAAHAVVRQGHSSREAARRVLALYEQALARRSGRWA